MREKLWSNLQSAIKMVIQRGSKSSMHGTSSDCLSKEVSMLNGGYSKGLKYDKEELLVPVVKDVRYNNLVGCR